MNQKGFAPIFLLVGLVILALIGGGIYYFSASKLPINTPTSTSVPTQIITPTPLPSLTLSTNDDMLTYVNSKFSYQIKYPKDWIAVSFTSAPEDQTGAINFKMKNDQIPAESGFLIGVLPDEDNTPLSQLIIKDKAIGDVSLGTKGVSSTKVIINNITWEKFSPESLGFIPTGYVEYSTVHNNTIYMIVIYSADQKIIDQILATFKFTN